MSSTSSTRRRPAGKDRSRSKTGNTDPSRRRSKAGKAVSSRRVAKPSRPPAQPRRTGHNPDSHNPDSLRAGPSSDQFVGRRQEIRRQQGARRLRVVLTLTVVSLLAVSTIGILNSELADVDTVTVVGNDRTTSDEVVAATAIVVGTPLLDLDLRAAENGVELLPWVRRAELDRNLDGEIIVTVTEREAVLALPIAGPGGDGRADAAGAGQFVLVDQLGQQLEVVAERPADFLPVSGVEASGRPGESAPVESGLLLSIVQSLPPGLAGSVSAMTVSDGDLYLELSSGGRANLGDSSELGGKIQALETVLARVDLDCVSVIDLRVPSAAAVRRAESPEGACI